jgi:hypothetical protein
MSPAVARLLRVVDEAARCRTAVAALLVAFLVYALVEGPKQHVAGTTDLETTLFLKLIPLIVAIWLTAFLAIRFAYYRLIEGFECRDASDSPTRPKTRIAKQGQDLVGAGFRLLGEMKFRMSWQGWKRAWVFVDPTGTVTCPIGSGVVPLSTCWPDGSFVATAIGIPSGIRRARQSVRVLVRPRTSLVDRYRRHFWEAQAFAAGRPPIRYSSMQEYLAKNPAAVAPTRKVLGTWFSPVMVTIYGLTYVLLVSWLVT